MGRSQRTARSDGAELRVDAIRLTAALPERLGPKPGAAAHAQFKAAFKGDGLIGGYRHCLAARLVLGWKEYPPTSPSSSRWCSHEIAINGIRWQPTQRSEQAFQALVTSAARVAAADMKQAGGRALRHQRSRPGDVVAPLNEPASRRARRRDRMLRLVRVRVPQEREAPTVQL